MGKARKIQKNLETQLDDLREQVKDASATSMKLNHDLAESALSLCRGQGMKMKSFSQNEEGDYYQLPIPTLPKKTGATRKYDSSDV